MRKVIAIVAALGCTAGIYTFIASFFGLTMDKLGAKAVLLHLGLFALGIPLVFAERWGKLVNPFLGKPRWVVRSLQILFLLFGVVFVTFLALSHAASPEIINGDQDISGEWPVPIEKADVQLIFSEGWPNDTSISADTGTESNFQFDCVRTNLPSGVRFETTHPIEPRNRLFISARFSQRGYFVSNPKEDGFRAIVENHPHLFPWLVFLSGLIVFTTAGFAVARPALKVLGPYQGFPTDQRIAVTVAVVATVLSTVSLFVFREPYTAMPGFLLGAITSIGISGNPPRGIEPFSLLIVGAASNLFFYYLVARGLQRIWPRRNLPTGEM